MSELYDLAKAGFEAALSTETMVCELSIENRSQGNGIDCARIFEVKELSVPVAQADDLRKYYRIIAGDERNTVALKAVAK